jgi:hypothetical protein
VCHALLHDPRFFALLLQIDEELAAQTQAKACICLGPLHRADYPRKPRGCPPEARGSVERRFSFCCDRCRKRTTSPSVRFFGRRVYLSLAVVLSSSRHAGSNSAARLMAELGVAWHTLRRWRGWWQEAFTRTPLWVAGRGAFMPPLDEARLPEALLERFVAADEAQRMGAALRFLAPLTVRGDHSA